jgi:TatD DNase family protein
MIHAFSGDGSMAARLAAAGLVVSFALPLTFRSAAGPRGAATMLAAGSILVETDAPYLGPDRDANNEPSTTIRVVAELARLRDEEPEAIVRAVRATYGELIGT